MSRWIPVYQFPLDKDLSELARFVRRCRLPLRIAEENNRQVLTTPDPQLGEFLVPLITRWEAGEIDLARVHLEPVEGEGPQESEGIAEPAKSAAGKGKAGRGEKEAEEETRLSPLPSWPLQKTPLSLVLIAACFIGWFLLRNNLAEALLIYPDRGGGFQLDTVLRNLGSSTLAWHWANGEYWRLWTPAIVHFSLPHALFNALGIWILGRPLEARAGTLAFALLVLVSAPVANLAQYYWSPQIVFGGMSGVVYALVGAVFVLQRWRPGWRDVPAGLVPLALGWLLLCATGLVTYVIGTGIANAAHIGGFICGLLLALIYCLAGGAHNFSDKPASA